jgi:acetoin utilization deacetylase AcuC-like enzyme
LVSNVAVAAARLAAEGERVLIVDFDAHHGNGTQDVFFDNEQVLFVSLHQWPLYPGTGWYDEIGLGVGRGKTMNIPLPPGTTGDAYLAAFDRLIQPKAVTFAPTWLIVSAGYDAHRNDPITNMSLSAADYALMMDRLVRLVPEGRTLVMLEGGYDLEALTLCTAATLGVLAGISPQTAAMEPATAGGTSLAWDRLDEIADYWNQLDAER